MNLLKTSLLAAVASVAFGSAALAETKPTIVFNAGVANNYLFRGLSQTAGKVQGFGGADLTYGPVYVGTWISNVDFQGNTTNGDTTSIETDFYGGVAPVWHGTTFTLGGIYYTYWGTPSALPGTDNYFELKAGISRPFGKVTLGGQYFHSWEFPYSGGSANYYEGDAAYAVNAKTTISGALGYQDLSLDKAGLGVLDNYWTWNVGVTYAITDHLSIDGRYSGVSSNAKDFYGRSQDLPFNTGDRFVATLKATF